MASQPSALKMSERHYRDLVSILDDLMAKHPDAEIAALPGLLFGLHVFSQESRIRGLRFATLPHREALPIAKGQVGSSGGWRGKWGRGRATGGRLALCHSPSHKSMSFHVKRPGCGRLRGRPGAGGA
jgi:hypothetical protein